MNDTQSLIGKLLDANARSDAIHIAVAPVIAGEALRAGQRVSIDADGRHVRATGAAVGVIDPFLIGPVAYGERCWLFLLPNTVTGMRHEWQHPAFPIEDRIYIPAGATTSEIRLREIAAEIGIGYDEMMYAANDWLQHGEYLTQQGPDSWRDDFPQYADEFWDCYATLKNKVVPNNKRESFFSCSC